MAVFAQEIKTGDKGGYFPDFSADSKDRAFKPTAPRVHGTSIYRILRVS